MLCVIAELKAQPAIIYFLERNDLLPQGTI